MAFKLSAEGASPGKWGKESRRGRKNSSTGKNLAYLRKEKVVFMVSVKLTNYKLTERRMGK